MRMSTILTAIKNRPFMGILHTSDDALDTIHVNNLETTFLWIIKNAVITASAFNIGACPDCSENECFRRLEFESLRNSEAYNENVHDLTKKGCWFEYHRPVPILCILVDKHFILQTESANNHLTIHWYDFTRTKLASRRSSLAGTSNAALMTSPPSSHRTFPYCLIVAFFNFNWISATERSKRVAKDIAIFLTKEGVIGSLTDGGRSTQLGSK